MVRSCAAPKVANKGSEEGGFITMGIAWRPTVGPMNADRAATAASLDNLPLDDRGDLITMPNDKRLGPGVITARDPAQRHLADHDVAEPGAGLDRELVIFVIGHGRLPVIVSGPLVGAGSRRVQ